MQIMSPLTAGEYTALKADIASRGVRVPVVLDADTDEVIDGYHRLQACRELGIVDYPTIKRHFANDQERQEEALKLNILRRHLGPVSWANAFRQLCEVRGIRLGTQGRQEAKSDTVSVLAQELGVSDRTAERRLALADTLATYPDLAAKVDSGEMAAKRARRVVRERRAEQRRLNNPVPVPMPEGIDLRHCSLTELALPEASVDLIFTDPPYSAEDLPLWDALGQLAARVLKPGRLLIAYSGQFCLPAVMEALGRHLEYVWLGLLYLPGPHNQIRQRHIWSLSKPLLFYAQAPFEPGAWFRDTYFHTGSELTKEHHPWEQGIGPAQYYLTTLTLPGDLVVDPFLGSGTTALAALQTGRRFVGCDIDGKALVTARERLSANE